MHTQVIYVCTYPALWGKAQAPSHGCRNSTQLVAQVEAHDVRLLSVAPFQLKAEGFRIQGAGLGPPFRGFWSDHDRSDDLEEHVRTIVMMLVMLLMMTMMVLLM